MATQAQIDGVLKRLATIEGSLGGLIVDAEGMVVASQLDKSLPSEKIGALASQAVAMARRVLSEAKLGDPDTMIFEGTQGKFALIYAPKGGFFISLLGREEMNLGMARLQLDEALDALE